MAVVANLHDKRIVELPDGEIFNTVSHGKGMMQAYAPQVPVEDRWAIIAYLRALQLSRLGDGGRTAAGNRARNSSKRMSQPDDFSNEDPHMPPPLDLSKWRNLPMPIHGRRRAWSRLIGFAAELAARWPGQFRCSLARGVHVLPEPRARVRCFW